MSEIRHCEGHGYFDARRCPTCEARGDHVLSVDRRRRVSKFLSGALRHFPADVGLDLDAAGWADRSALAARAREKYEWLPEGAIEAIVRTDPKGRFEADGDLIRAAYGHSVAVDLDAEDTPVPDVLYHGTTPEAYPAIREDGLKPMSRQHVHLSGSVETARKVGSRHAADPVVLRVDADGMVEGGREITKRGQSVYTTDGVPPRFLSRYELPPRRSGPHSVHGAISLANESRGVTGFDAVVFDLDDTLCRHTGDMPAVYRAAFGRIGTTAFGEPEELWAALEGPPDPDDQIGYLGAGFARLAAQYDRPDADPIALAEALVAEIDPSAVDFLPGAETVLKTARSVGPVGVLTNGPADRQRGKVETLELDSRVDAVVYAGDLDRRKPHVDPFERIIRNLDVEADRTLHVGNSLAYDVAGAHNAGLQAAWLRTDGEVAGDYRPEYVVDSLADVETIIGRS